MATPSPLAGLSCPVSGPFHAFASCPFPLPGPAMCRVHRRPPSSGRGRRPPPCSCRRPVPESFVVTWPVMARRAVRRAATVVNPASAGWSSRGLPCFCVSGPPPFAWTGATSARAASGGPVAWPVPRAPDRSGRKLPVFTPLRGFRAYLRPACGIGFPGSGLAAGRLASTSAARGGLRAGARGPRGLRRLGSARRHPGSEPMGRGVRGLLGHSGCPEPESWRGSLRACPLGRLGPHGSRLDGPRLSTRPRRDRLRRHVRLHPGPPDGGPA